MCGRDAEPGEFAHVRPPFVPGLEVSGYIREIGEGVEGFQVGEPVAAMTLTELGAFASVVSVRPELTVPLRRLDAELALEEAAASIVNLTTAYMTILDVVKMRKGESVLVHAAAGGLGSFLGQVARHFGAGLVLGTVGRADKTALAASLGYDELFVRSRFAEDTLRLTVQQGVHAVLDPVGGEVRTKSFEVLQPLGRLVVLGNAGGRPDAMHSYSDLWFNNRILSGFQIGSYSLFNPELVGTRALEALNLLARKELRSEVHGIYTLDGAEEAFRLLAQGVTRGKLLLKVN
ncbi:zinc-binding dehydrogenase [Paenibacillus sp. P26]|nr:zinc-binding dehydrogenase [Paenibacillus sp. P26]